MTIENQDATDETIDGTSTDADAADETPTSDSPADDDSSSSASASEEAGDEEQVEETPEQKTEREKAERKAARMKVADEAEQRAAEARRERQRKRDEDEANERLRAREYELQQLIAETRAIKADLDKRRDATLKGGIDGLKALGIDYTEWTKKTLEESGPEALAQRALSRIDELESEIRRRDQKEAQTRQEQEQQESVKRFERFATDNAEDFPDAATLTPRMFKILADEAALEYMRESGGRAPTFPALLPRLDRKAKEFHDELKARSAKQARSDDKPSDGATNTQAKPNGQSASSPANRTLSNAAATTKASAKRPPTDEELEEWALEELRQAMAADTKLAKQSA